MKNFIPIICFAVAFSSCRSLFYETKISKNNNLTIVNHPDSIVYNMGKLDSLKKYNESSTSNGERDLRCRDVSNLDLKNNRKELLHCDFDSKTIWPDSLPVGFNPDSIMEIGKNPGLHIRDLHQMGITGKGVRMAIIDQHLLVDHREYKDQLKMYEEVHSVRNGKAAMHGPAVASIAVGKTVGVAPDAELYYIASELSSIWVVIKYKLFKNRNVNPKWYAKSIDRILEINKTLPSDNKIRVISISFGSNKKCFLDAIAKANREGVFVISSVLSRTNTLRFNGLGRECLNSPDDVNSYSPGIFWSPSFYKNAKKFRTDSTLMVPMDSRSTASHSGINSYVHYTNGGWSWSIPYIAGLYALACQVKPTVTPGEFWAKGLDTGDTIETEKNGKKYKLGKIVNPVKLMESLK